MARSFAFAGLIARGEQTLAEYLERIDEGFRKEEELSPYHHIFAKNYGPIPEATLDEVYALDENLTGILCMIIAKAVVQASKIMAFAIPGFDREDIAQHLAMDAYRELCRVYENDHSEKSAIYCILDKTMRDASDLKVFINNMDSLGLEKGERLVRIHKQLDNEGEEQTDEEWYETLMGGSEGTLERWELVEEMRAFCDGLPTNAAKAIVAYYVEGKTEQQVAEKIGIAQQNVNKWLRKYREPLAHHMGAPQEVPEHTLTIWSIKKCIRASSESWADLTPGTHKLYDIENTSEPFTPDGDFSEYAWAQRMYTATPVAHRKVRLYCMTLQEHGQTEEFDYIRGPLHSPWSNGPRLDLSGWVKPLLDKNTDRKRVEAERRRLHTYEGFLRISKHYWRMWGHND